MRDGRASAGFLIRRRLRALAHALPAAHGGDAAAVHQARVATRRLREALPLVLRGARGRRIRRQVRRLTRALGPVRELDVALETLDALAAAGEAPRGAAARLTQAIRHERRGLHDVMCRELAHVDVEKLRRRALAAARKGASPAADARAARRAARLRSAIENAGSLYLPDRLHQVRIAVKKLRYSLELVRVLRRSRATAAVRRLQEAQDLLGRLHDLEVLIARVRAIQASSQAPTLRLSSDLDRLVRRLETECRERHGQYMRTRRMLLTICAHVAAGGRGRVRLPAAA